MECEFGFPRRPRHDSGQVHVRRRRWTLRSGQKDSRGPRLRTGRGSEPKKKIFCSSFSRGRRSPRAVLQPLKSRDSYASDTKDSVGRPVLWTGLGI